MQYISPSTIDKHDNVDTHRLAVTENYQLINSSLNANDIADHI